MWLTNEILVVNLDLNLNKQYWTNKIIEAHKKYIYTEKGNNFLLNDEFSNLTNILIENFHKITKEEYSSFFGNYIFLPENKNYCWVYVSNQNDYKTGIHNHLKTSVINSVFYFNIPSNTSGGISFFDNQFKKFLTYQPKNYDLIIFPNYLFHEPEKTNTDEYRISINMEIICKNV